MFCVGELGTGLPSYPFPLLGGLNLGEDLELIAQKNINMTLNYERA